MDRLFRVLDLLVQVMGWGLMILGVYRNDLVPLIGGALILIYGKLEDIKDRLSK